MTFLRHFSGLKCSISGLITLQKGGRGVISMCSAFAASHVGRYQSSKIEQPLDCNPLLKHLTMKIKSTGPITVAEYMKEVLTNPVKGYYMHHDMLGEHGDFITSPEISQIFGELLGIWCISEWLSGGKSKSLNLVELGPGRGTLMDDILRVFSQFQHLLNTCNISIHLVEVSSKLSEIQALKLTGKSIETKYDETSSVFKKGITKSGLPVNWYYDIRDVPPGYTFYIAHEFFDALPIHKLQADEKRDHVEVSPSAAVIIQKLARQIRSYGGAALIADYGHSGGKTDTFRGFKAHQLHDVLIAPGSADLTADVDFSFLKRIIGNTVASLGPITQHEFLKNMGIDLRLKVLLEKNKDAATQQHLIQSYNVLMNSDKMGERFKFFSIFPDGRLKISNSECASVQHQPVAGFTPLQLS
ncbi:protein arginine methyltransferase NDUFAF7, mitochondrial isoform X2 [Mixophyes fleayi]|uniref:protein arginine methyltransferase NDUFAF7, mitochondrial isoform X2 n=1 Tax=Mixophyes fleayi TaxID=3061075 RepID=UPI003F4D7654